MDGWGRVGDWQEPLDYLFGTKNQIAETDWLPNVYNRAPGEI
jgi:hypothetical protein